MADEMEKALAKDQQSITAGAQTEQLSDKDFEKVVGGDGSSAPRISEFVITKQKDIATP